MKIGFYSPYLHILGGGEQYILSMASILSQNHTVDVFGDKKVQIKAQNFLGFNLEKVNFLPWIASKTGRILKTKEYDCFFYVTDGSLFISLGKKNFLIVQVPQRSMYKWTFGTQIKLLSWPNVFVYSNYVKNYIDSWWHTKAIVFPPAINTREFKTEKKKNIILSVGRFFPLPHSKKQGALVEAFKLFCKRDLKDWKLIFAGGVDSLGRDYLNSIQKKAKGLPIEFYPNLSRDKLLKLYGEAKIYWHGAGFGEDLEKYPERAEHFGITTLEAMASGCVPLVFPAGGQKEIVNDDIDGLYWHTRQELVQKTINIINNVNLWKFISIKAIEKSMEYDLKIFQKKIEELVR